MTGTAMRSGPFKDVHRGNGWYVSFKRPRGHILFAVRPFNWRLARVKPPGKPGYVRVYVGPFEVETYNGIPKTS